MREKLLSLIAREDGQALTSNAGFLAVCSLLAYGAYHYGGDHLHGLLDMIVNSAPPGTSSELFGH